MTFRLVACHDPACNLIHGISVVRTSRPASGADLAPSRGRRARRDGSPALLETPVRLQARRLAPLAVTAPPHPPVARVSTRAGTDDPVPGTQRPACPQPTSAAGTRSGLRAGHRHPGVADQRGGLTPSTTTPSG